MKKNLADIIENLYESKSTGLLTIIFASEKNLFKFYFKTGQIYYLSFGFKKGVQCLNEIISREPVSYNFIPQISVDITSNDIPSTEDIITTLRNMNKFINSEDPMSFHSSDFQKIKDVIKTALIRQIGPIGSKITEKYIAEKWIPANPPSKNDLLNLVNLLKEEIEDPASRKEFLNEVNKFIGGL
ncbi:hypothetical protein [Thermodesulfovibrio yellowstonii]|uniref:DUF8082 domain-containing protein n=2 Tax=Thermodesulfovibrio yellowstonii TaxID=28262 RepID=B5YJ28_THEYD|nr:MULTISPECIES: hypothetical protein [Thermodesulfovibrio]ACI21357.1 hypothetical protein THEYE_A0396 [Thermodesulfovibrio yellowstonii DSM 11347]MDI6865050.1 hypothetical protein [Thermodesulfovibrio yellowstonii]GLI54238.1 hypothetical protein TISLANDTSLP1_19310 [Thermodesulfovibrio islandicus]